tara:strand:+ start:247 stop:420 length:174 start_codon:yes stop_codon:yes gene_type:complete
MLLVPVEFEVLESASVIESLVCMEQEFIEKIMAIRISGNFEKEVLAMVRRGLSKGRD